MQAAALAAAKAMRVARRLLGAAVAGEWLEAEAVLGSSRRRASGTNTSAT